MCTVSNRVEIVPVHDLCIHRNKLQQIFTDVAVFE